MRRSALSALHREPREPVPHAIRRFFVSLSLCVEVEEKGRFFIMGKKTKTIAAVAVLVVLVAAALVCWKLYSPQASAGAKTVSVEVTHGDGSVKNFTLNTDAQFLWDAMDEAGLIGGRDSEYGKWVTLVDGETADEAAGQYWLFTKGGEWVTTSCNKTPIADGEHYEFLIYAS
jgi:hypothetical protein